ncbi:MAG: hypothetical protein JRJ57_10215 [Deltaproteobacteria bacterium]|nr:hypothetical protein [Deltaproteobacteria bacterium]
MKNLENIKDEFYSFPKNYQGNYQSFIEELLEEYLKRLPDFDSWLADDIRSNKDKIESLCEAINSSIDLYLNGLTAQAYKKLKSALDSIKDFMLYPKPDKILLAGGNKLSYFRIRESFNNVDKSGIFHIPFQLRHLTSSQRYSIPGVPCLYLSNSLHLCWEELGRPTNKRLFAARFEIDRNTWNIINISYTPLKIVNLYNKMDYESEHSICKFFLRSTLLTWPLIVACSIRKKLTNADFSVEYIIPQLLLQWALENKDIDGIAYYSNRSWYTDFMEKPLYQENLAIPVKTNLEYGLCTELKKKTPFTDVIKISAYKYLRNLELRKEDIDVWIEKNMVSRLNQFGRSFITKEKSPTVFDRVEIELLKKEPVVLT